MRWPIPYRPGIVDLGTLCRERWPKRSVHPTRYAMEFSPITNIPLPMSHRIHSLPHPHTRQATIVHKLTPLRPHVPTHCSDDISCEDPAPGHELTLPPSILLPHGWHHPEIAGRTTHATCCIRSTYCPTKPIPRGTGTENSGVQPADHRTAHYSTIPSPHGVRTGPCGSRMVVWSGVYHVLERA